MQELADNVTSQKAVVLLNTDGAKTNLSASAAFGLRKQVKEKGISLKVVKNTLIRLAFKDVEGFPENFVGSTYLAFLDNPEGSDEVTVPKAVVEAVSDSFKDNINVLGAVVNNEFYDSSKTVTLSKTPSLQDSMAMLAGTIKQIAGGKIASLVKEIPSKVARVASEYSKTLS